MALCQYMIRMALATMYLPNYNCAPRTTFTTLLTKGHPARPHRAIFDIPPHRQDHPCVLLSPGAIQKVWCSFSGIAMSWDPVKE